MLEQIDFGQTESILVFLAFVFEEIFEPRRLVSLANLFLIAILAFSNQWVPLMYIIVPWLPSFVMNFMIYPFIPYINLPKIFI